MCNTNSKVQILYDKKTEYPIHYTAVNTFPGSFRIKYAKPLTVKVKAQQFLYRPGKTLSVPEGCGLQIAEELAHEGGKVVNPTHRPPLPQKYSWC